MPARLVECLGLPGTGKTTLCLALLGRGGWTAGKPLNTKIWRAWPLGRRLRLSMTALFWEAGAFISVMWAVAALGLWRKPRPALRAMQLPVQRYWLKQQLARKRSQGDGILLFDQGIGMVLWSVLDEAGCHSPQAAAMDRLVRRLYRDIAVTFLFLDADHVTAARRIAARTGGESRFDAMPHETIAARLAPAQGLLRLIETALAKIGPVAAALDATRPTDALADQAAAGCGWAK
jgi:AAA domain